MNLISIEFEVTLYFGTKLGLTVFARLKVFLNICLVTFSYILKHFQVVLSSFGSLWLVSRCLSYTEYGILFGLHVPVVD